MLNKLAWAFTDRGKRDFDDCKAQANLGYAHALASYDPSRGASFSTWVYNQALGKLLSRQTRSTKQYATEKQVEDDGRLNRNESTRRCHLWEMLSSDLSEDARLLVEIVIDAPAEIAWAVGLGGRNPARARHSIYEYLRGTGWSFARISNAFLELRETLC
jgi:hypothetical protein